VGPAGYNSLRLEKGDRGHQDKWQRLGEDAIMSLFFNFRIRGPTDAEEVVIRWVLFWGVFLAFAGLGATCVFLGYQAPPEKAVEAARAIRLGFMSVGIAAAMYIVRRYFCGYSSS
jgi:hypothetical protein